MGLDCQQRVSGVQNTNGITLDGTQTSGSPLPPIQNVTINASESKGFTGRQGVYAANVQGLTVSNSTFGGNYNGLWMAGCNNFLLIGNRCGAYVPPVAPYPSGNTNFGIFIDQACSAFIVQGNLGFGNGQGNVVSTAAPTAGIILGNFP